MKLLFKQRVFSWLDSYDIYDEAGEPLYTVKGRLALGHLLEIYDRRGELVGTVREELLTLLPRFTLYEGDRQIGEVKKELTFLRPVYTLQFRDWRIEGDIFDWDYTICTGSGEPVATITKKLLSWSDTYEIAVQNPADALHALMAVLAIDAANCSNN